MNEYSVKQLFARRIFTSKERENMKELYAHAELLALRILKTVPQSLQQERAIVRIKDVLADCETAVALHPSEMDAAQCEATAFRECLASNGQGLDKSLHPERSF
jgi:hypothetical protein